MKERVMDITLNHYLSKSWFTREKLKEAIEYLLFNSYICKMWTLCLQANERNSDGWNATCKPHDS